MREIWNVVQIIFATLGGVIGWFLGGFDGLIYTLVVFVVIDYITGLMVAITTEKVSSRIGFKGIAKKVVIFSLVGIGQMLDFYIIQNGSAIRTAVVFFYLSNEGLSILENTSRIGLPIPEKLKKVFMEMKEEKNNE
ncbi:toxin secretion/phage lysis holin [Desulfitispora alkaliphila]|uniref:phage holin family protein n=1 Tax=Desulfitispora alkaliphila TaxID=622674 RepID=UPI003D1E470D